MEMLRKFCMKNIQNNQLALISIHTNRIACSHWINRYSSHTDNCWYTFDQSLELPRIRLQAFSGFIVSLWWLWEYCNKMVQAHYPDWASPPMWYYQCSGRSLYLLCMHMKLLLWATVPHEVTRKIRHNRTDSDIKMTTTSRSKFPLNIKHQE